MDTAILQLIADGETQGTAPRSRSDTELLRAIATAVTGVTQTSRSDTRLLEIIATAKSGVLQQSLSDTELLQIYALANSGQVQTSLSEAVLLRVISVVPMTNQQKLDYGSRIPLSAPAGIRVRVIDAGVVINTPVDGGVGGVADGLYIFDPDAEMPTWRLKNLYFFVDDGSSQIILRDVRFFGVIMQSASGLDCTGFAPWGVPRWEDNGGSTLDPQPVFTNPVVQQTVAVRPGTPGEGDWELVP